MYNSFHWVSHTPTIRTVFILGKVINKEPLRIGSGKTIALTSVTDLEVLKVYNNKIGGYVPVIPGSSWKGVFRSHAVSLLRSYGVNVCDGVPGATCLKGDEWISYRDYGLQEKIRAIVDGELRMCLLCLVFGSAGYSSHIRFSDSQPLDSWRLGYRTGVSIDRRTGAARRRALYTVEYVEPGAVFDFSIMAKNVPNYVLGLLITIMNDISSGVVKIGGFKSRGFGWVEFKDLRLEVVNSRGQKILGKLEPLDPIDKDVEIKGEWGEDSPKFVQIFLDSIGKLAEISARGWRWGGAVAEHKEG